jgi:hypothetical protein
MVWEAKRLFLMSTSGERQAFWRVLSHYLVPVVAVCFAVISTLWLGPALKHSSAVFFCSVMVSSWYGGFLPGLFASMLSWLALDYYFTPPIDSLGMNPDTLPAMMVFGAAACFRPRGYCVKIYLSCLTISGVLPRRSRHDINSVRRELGVLVADDWFRQLLLRLLFNHFGIPRFPLGLRPAIFRSGDWLGFDPFTRLRLSRCPRH